MFIVQDRENYILPNVGQVSFDGGPIPEYITGLKAPWSADAEMSFECEINMPLFAKLCGIDLGQGLTSASVLFQSPYQVQARRHKKKRINKKWAKRYGYITKFKNYRLEEVYIRQSGEHLDIYGSNVKIF